MVTANSSPLSTAKACNNYHHCITQQHTGGSYLLICKYHNRKSEVENCPYLIMFKVGSSLFYSKKIEKYPYLIV